MNKKIIICCDGTWNYPGQRDHGAVTETNVQRINSLLVRNEQQKVFYVDGVGCGQGFFSRSFGGIFGTGLNSRVQQAYAHIVENYRYGDDIYLFGFSRGAYTARSVAGFIRNCGILKTSNADLLQEAFNKYRNIGEEYSPDSERMQKFRLKYSHRNQKNREQPIPIKFIGVWDTVGALGIPATMLNVFNKDILELGFHDLKLSRYVENAYQALAIDEKRKIFEAALWRKTDKNTVLEAPKQTMEQVWFAGVHTNIGGGYRKDKLCNTSLLWMIDRAHECQLEFDMTRVKEEVVKFMDFNFKAEESYKNTYTIVSPFTRNIYGRRDTNEMIHYSVIERFASSEKYDPKNLLHALGWGIPIDNRKSVFL